MTNEIAPQRDRWSYPFQIALAATWRLLLTMTAVVLVPAGAISFLFAVIGMPVIVIILVLMASALFVFSYYLHELGHSFATWVLAGRARISREMIADGGFARARIHRWSLGTDDDALVSTSGPAAAALAGLVLLLPCWPFLISFPFCCLFLVHLANLVPRFSDGGQLFAALSERYSDAHRE
jgi:hypothetical protein